MGDLWYHALKFLDKYRTDIQSHDVSDLYTFDDSTGILERHKQLLSEPFKEGQVDMKIMYYELVRMLIDYERKNHPQTYDATKTVGKIEGYQELTNKLQRDSLRILKSSADNKSTLLTSTLLVNFY